MISGQYVAITATLNRKTKFDRTSTPSVIYLGRALAGAGEDKPMWHVRKMVYALPDLVDLVEVLDANGSLEANQRWDQRTILNYF